MKKLSIVLLAVITLTACKKRKQFSHWKINGQQYSSNNVESTIGKVIAALNCLDNNGFNIKFYSPYLSTSGEWTIVQRNTNQHYSFVVLNFYVDKQIYHISPNENKKLSASKNNNKARYTLPPSWFVNYDNQNDSVLIEGIFNEP